MTDPPVVLREVELAGRLVDITIDGIEIGRVEARTGGAAAGLSGDGGAVLPGLHDHHIHLLALAAARGSVSLHDCAGPSEMAATLRCAAARQGRGAWLRAVAYDEGTLGPLDRARLDAIVGDRPARVQHRSGALWVLNSAALDAVGLGTDGRAHAAHPEGCEVDQSGRPTGRLFRLDEWLRDRLPARPLDLAAVGHELIARGVTSVTDATPHDDDGAIDLLASPALAPHVTVMGAPDLDPDRIAPPLSVGPAKILLTDHDLPPLAAVVDMIRAARSHGRAVAVHCVTSEALVLTLTALDETGSRPGDRIEHGALITPALFDTIRRLRLIVVTQPNFVAERGDDYLRDVAVDQHDDLWRCASLRDAGIGVAAGTDAPFGSSDPWCLVAAAVERRTADGRVVGEKDRLTAHDALGLLLGHASDPAGPRRSIEPGARADLCVLDRGLDAAMADPAAVVIRHVIVGGVARHVDGQVAAGSSPSAHS